MLHATLTVIIVNLNDAAASIHGLVGIRLDEHEIIARPQARRNCELIRACVGELTPEDLHEFVMSAFP